MIVNGINFKEPELYCTKCNNSQLTYKYLPTNRSIQARCAICDKWLDNVKYDYRSSRVKIHEAIELKRIEDREDALRRSFDIP